MRFTTNEECVSQHGVLLVCSTCGQQREVAIIFKHVANGDSLPPICLTCLTKGSEVVTMYSAADAHIHRHQLLHQKFDELLADYLENNRAASIYGQLVELMEWSAKQTKQPDHALSC